MRAIPADGAGGAHGRAGPSDVTGAALAPAAPPEGLLVTAVALGTVLAPLNSTMIAVALPSITADLTTDAAAASWLVTAYLIAMASLQPVAGRLGDRLGRRRLILAGLAGFGLASVGAALAPSLPLLVLCRVAQAVSGAIVLPNGDALLREAVPEARRAGRFGLVGSAVGLAAAAGPPLGGVLVTVADWRVMFAVNLLVVAPALALGWRVLPRPAGQPTGTRRPGTGFDWPGALLLSTLLAGLAGLLARGVDVLPGAATLGAVGVLAIALALFAWRELRHPEPVLQPRFFQRPAFAAATGAVGLSNLAMYSLLLALPLLWAGAGRSSVETGRVLGVMAAAMVVGAPVGGRLADRLGRRLPTVAGLTLLTLGALQLAVGGATAPGTAVLALAVVGGGLGLATPGLQTAALESVERRDAGAAAGAYATSRYLGSIVGSALLAGLAGAALDTGGLWPLFGGVVAAGAASTLLALGLPPRPARAT